MPLVNVKLIEGVFTDDQKQEIVEKLTEAMVKIEGENMRGVTWVVIDEVKSGDWGDRWSSTDHRARQRARGGRARLVHLVTRVEPFVGLLAAFPQIIVDAAAGRMYVEQACTTGTWVRKRVHDADRRSDERAGAEAQRLVAEQELGLALEDVERVDVIVVAVRLRPVEAGFELELHERKLVAPDLDRGDAVVRLQAFPLAGAEVNGLGSRRAAAGGDVDAVEAAGLAAVPRAQMLCEAAVRRVEVEEPCAGRAPEPVNDPGRRAGARAGRKHLLLVFDQDGELALAGAIHDSVHRVRV